MRDPNLTDASPETPARSVPYREIFQAMPGLHILFTAEEANFTIAGVSDEFLKMAGLPRQEVVGRSLEDVFLPAEAAEGLGRSLTRALSSGSADRISGVTYAFRAASGVLSQQRTSGGISKPVRASDGGICFVVHSMENILDEATRRAEQRFRSAFNQQFQFMAMLAPDGVVLEINDLPLRTSGFTREQVVGRCFWDTPFWADLPAMRERWPSRLARAAESDGPVLSEDQFETATGEIRIADAAVTAVKDAAGAVDFFLIQASDITERRRLEQALAERERRYNTLFNSVDEGFCICEMIWDEAGRPKDYRFVEFNPWFESATGLRRDIALNATARAIVPGLEDTWVQRYGQVVISGRPERFESYSAAMGRWFNVYASAVGGDQFALLFNDITDLKAAEAERNQLLQQIDAERARLQQVFAQAPMPVAVLRGREMVFELANPPYEELFPGRVVRGRPLLEVIPEVSPEVLEILRQVMATGEPFVGHEYPLPLDRDRDGLLEDYWFTFVYHPLQDADGTVSGIVALAVDVTAHVQARQQLELANRELEEFAYVASHDLQEPLRTVNTFTELLLRRTDLGIQEEARTYGAYIRQSVARMEELIRDLLSYSRTIHTSGSPSSTVDLSRCVEEAMDVLRERINETGARIDVDPLPVTRGDHVQLAQVFQNLLANSLKYQRPGSVPEIRIEAQPAADHWIISVRDNGIGFEQQYAERIFGLFKRLHKDAFPGTGLGLAICKRAVERNGGRIWAESRPDEGATFYFTLLKSEQ